MEEKKIIFADLSLRLTSVSTAAHSLCVRSDERSPIHDRDVLMELMTSGTEDCLAKCSDLTLLCIHSFNQPNEIPEKEKERENAQT